jgi:hypothetical protein
MGVLGRYTILCALVAVLWVHSAVAQISPGELAQKHAALEGMKNCLKCHKLGEGPSAGKCLECHKEIAFGMEQQKGYHHVAVTVEKKSCFSCHSDHAGREFRLVTWPGGDRGSFDHTATGWELEGAHTKQKCRDCHKQEFISDDLAQFRESVNLNTTFLGLSEACLACHQDEHRDQMEQECTSCHGVHEWKSPAGFDHARTTYPLTGKHAAVPCGRCHAVESDPAPWDKDNAFARYRPVAHNNCSSCHRDVHAGRLGADCASCHATADWHEIAGKRFDHNRTRYPLQGMHARVACEKCHTQGLTQQLVFATCTDCHRDRHDGQFAARADGGRCESCHDVSGFRPAHYTVADHATTRFPLDGAHLAQPCVACHRPAPGAPGVPGARYRIDDTRCQACHEDVHVGQFGDRACQSCHIVDRWQDVLINHDRDTAYRLEGEHRRVACGGCHVPVTAGGSTFVRYKPIDPSCRTCHTREGLELRKDS